MCGIAGILSLSGAPVSPSDIHLMCRAMVHRGPDDEGTYIAEGIGLGMRRLSIIDLAGGSQPVRNEDGSVWAVFNGEIYNFRELRRDLLARGHVFYTSSDTETIVHLYEELGERCVEPMRGMFAFAVWDCSRRRLLLARDRVGIKPLYYTTAGGRLSFASELKSLLPLPWIDRRVDWGAAARLFTSLATPQSQSILQGIRKLEPGHVLVVGPGSAPRSRRYWDLKVETDGSRSEDDWVQGLRAALDESVRLHLESDVPLGAFLSGGVDSSAVVAAMSRLVPGRVKTFSIGFPEGDLSELVHARAVAGRLGTEHHELVVDPDVVAAVDDIIFHLDEPFGDSSAIPTYMVSKLAAEHVKVVLSGDGGDELFAGYDKYVVEGRERRYARIPRPLRRLLGAVGATLPDGFKGRRWLQHLALDGVERYMDSTTIFRADEASRLFTPEARSLLAPHDPRREALAALEEAPGHWLAALQYLDLKSYLPLDILTKLDRMSMAHSLEARVPLLDHVFIEFAARIPPELKLRGQTTKYIFKKALRGVLPDAILDRPKKGFAIPLGRWFRGRLAEYLEDVLLGETTRARGVFDPRYVEVLVRSHQGGRDRDLQLWTLLCFELWCRRFLDGAPPRAERDPARVSLPRPVPDPGAPELSAGAP